MTLRSMTILSALEESNVAVAPRPLREQAMKTSMLVSKVEGSTQANGTNH